MIKADKLDIKMRNFVCFYVGLPVFIVMSWVTFAPAESTAADTEMACPDARLAQLVIPPSPNSKPVPPAQSRLRPYATDLALGVGYLRPAPGNTILNWLGQIRLPLFQNTVDEPFAWLIDGWLVGHDGGRQPFGIGGMIETDYELLSFIVYEIRSDGWLRLRYERGNGVEKGTAWTHQCLLKMGAIPLQLERWEKRFMSDAISPLYFRSKVRHALRAEPAISSKRLKWISSNRADYDLKPLEMRGDWMRVRLIKPSAYCLRSQPDKSQDDEGWVKWRDKKMGPWLWYYTRGC